MTRVTRVPARRPLVLVVDDDLPLIDLVREVLEGECDYVVFPYPEGAPTMDDIRRIDPDVIIVDQRLSQGALGWDFIQLLRATPDLAAVPVVFCTSDTGYLAQVALDVDRLRVTPLVKPFRVEHLMGEVAGALQRQGIDPAPCP